MLSRPATSDPLAQIAALLAEAAEAEARGDLDRASELARRATTVPASTGEHWWCFAQILADAGRTDELRAALDGVLVRDPGHLLAWSGLVEGARTDTERRDLLARITRATGRGLPEDEARRLARRLHGPSTSDASTSPAAQGESDSRIELLPGDIDLLRFQSWFAGREDVHARQWWSPLKGRGGYAPVPGPLTPGSLRRHFLGDETLGVYPIRLDGTCGFFALDLDMTPGAINAAHADPALATQVQQALVSVTHAARLRLLELGMPPLLESSGYKGHHLWVFFEAPVNAGLLFELGRRMVAELLAGHDSGFIGIEAFPRQPMRKDDGLGNLIKLPLGLHRRSGRRSVLLDEHLRPILRPFSLLRTLQKAPNSTVDAALARLPEAATVTHASAPTPSAERRGPRTAVPWEEPVGPSLPRPQLPGAFTEADLDRAPDVAWLLARCGVLRQVARDAVACRPLHHKSWLALRHTLGHSTDGVRAFNFLLERAKGPPSERLVSVLRGNSTSCQRVCGQVTEEARWGCTSCDFSWMTGTYPTPTLHWNDPSRPPAIIEATGDERLEGTVRTLGAMLQRLSALEKETRELVKVTAEGLRQRGGQRLLLAEGALSVETDADGRPALTFTPADGSAARTVSLAQGLLALGGLGLPVTPRVDHSPVGAS